MKKKKKKPILIKAKIQIKINSLTKKAVLTRAKIKIKFL